MGSFHDLLCEYQQAKRASESAYDVAANNPECATGFIQADRYAAEEEVATELRREVANLALAGKPEHANMWKQRMIWSKAAKHGVRSR